MNHNGPEGGIQPLPVQTWGEFQKGPDRPDFQIEGLLERGRSLLVSGPVKCLKTGITDDLAYSVATGSPALGKFATAAPARVLLVSGETPPEVKRRSLRVLEAARGYAIPADNLTFADGWFPRLPADVRQLEATVRRDGTAVVIIDPAYRALGEIGQSAANMFVFGPALLELSEALGQLGCATVLLHHMNERIKVGEWPELKHIAYSGFAPWARGWVLLNCRKRYLLGSGKHELLMATGGAGRSDLWHLDVDEGREGEPKWQVSVNPSDRIRSTSSTDPSHGGCDADARKVEDFLKKHPEGETKTVIRDKVGLTSKRNEAALAVLLAAGRVEELPVKKQGKKAGYNGYRLAGPQRSGGSG